MEEDFICNVLIMGKTGTGKSSLLNYLCDTNLAKTGSGKPVTGEGIYEYKASINGQIVRIFDSWGIEAGKVDRWKTLIDESLRDHGVHKNMEDWFHSVIYCIQAGGGRVEDVDSEIIKKFLSEGYLLTVVLTKADQIDEDDEIQMKNAILNDVKSAIPSNANSQGSMSIIATCSERKKTRSGETVPFGKEGVQKAILDGWKKTVVERIPKHVVARLVEYVSEWEYAEKQKLANSKISGAAEKNESIYKEIKSAAERLRKVDLSAYCREILDDIVANCQKADASIKKTFKIELRGMAEARSKEEDLKWWQWVLAIPVIPVALINVKLSEWIRSRSSTHIEEERRNIENYIEKVSAHLREECLRLEPRIAKEVTKAI